MGKLTDIQIRNLIKAGVPTAKSDGDGLTLTLSAKGTASWTLRYYIGGKRKELTIGRYPEFSLAKAREAAMDARRKVQQGTDVGLDKQRAKRETARAWTFRALADDYLAKAEPRLAAATMRGRKQQLRDYVMPRIGNMPAREVTPADIVEITEKVASKSLHVARLVLIALKEVFAHGIARHVIELDPCAHVKAKSVIGPRPISRTRIQLTEGELRAILPALAAIGRQNELMVKILLATATRIGELVNAEWVHIDFEQREWTIPAENAKNNKRFVIPLTDQVTGWFSDLHTLAFGSRFVMPVRVRMKGVEGDKPMEPVTLNAAINKLCVALGGKTRRFTPHDLRSTARSHFGALGIDVLIAERCLNHSLGGLVAVYDQHDYLLERRKALELWGKFIDCCESGRPWNITLLRREAA